MTIHNFDQILGPTLLKRGKDYYREEKIANLKEYRPGIWSATAFGTDEYQVTIQLRIDEIRETVCTCPFNGMVCKHSIATLYAIRAEKTGETLPPKKDKSGVTKKAAGKPTNEEKLDLIRNQGEVQVLLDLLFEEVEQNRELRNKMLNRFSSLWGESPEKAANQSIKAAISKSKRRGFIDYYSSTQLGMRLMDFVVEADQSWKNGQYYSALSILLALLESSIPTFEYADDSSGTMSMVTFQAFDKLREWSLSIPEKGKDREMVVQKLQKMVKNEIGEGFDFHDRLYESLCNWAKEEKDKSWILDYARAKVAAGKQNGVHEYRYSIDLENLCLALMISGKEEEAWEIKHANRHLVNRFLDDVYEKAVRSKDADLAKTFIDEGLNDKGKPGFVKKWRERLADWYLLKGDRQNFLDTLLKVATAERIERKYISAIKKKMQPDEWTEFRIQWMNACRNLLPYQSESLMELLLEGKELDSLWAILQVSPFHHLENYQSHFMDTHKEEIVERYRDHILDLASGIGLDRRTYKELADYLRKIKKMGAIDYANQIKDELLSLYRNRPSMRDELKNV